MKHALVEHVDCIMEHCPICDGGVASCYVCCGGEGSLTDTDCPGRPMSEPESDAVYQHGWDFENGYWFKKKERSR